MTQNRTLLATLGALLAAGGLTLALAAPAPATQIGYVLIGFGAALSLAALPFKAPPPPEPEEPPAQAPPPPLLPDARVLLAAFDDPLLLIQNRRVLIANDAARDLLGAHIEGEDVRLAIRHPAAAEQLLDRPGEVPEAATRTDLAGLGDTGQRWLMATASLPDGTRLVRLIDRSQAHAADRMRADFVANASHELRTPLATLLGFLETLEDDDAGGDAPTRLRFLKIMTGEAERMRSLVEDLISLSRIEAERYDVPRDAIDLEPLTEDVEDDLIQQLAQRGASLVFENRASSSLVAGDRAQLRQLLTNLVTNALRYGRAGTPVRIRLDDAGAELIRVSVIDEGDGIEAEHIPRLTERFYRVDDGRSRSVGGTGLGLAIVKHIALRHRGRLDIRSAPGEGTTVRVYLPRYQG